MNNLLKLAESFHEPSDRRPVLLIDFVMLSPEENERAALAIQAEGISPFGKEFDPSPHTFSSALAHSENSCREGS